MFKLNYDVGSSVILFENFTNYTGNVIKGLSKI